MQSLGCRVLVRWGWSPTQRPICEYRACSNAPNQIAAAKLAATEAQQRTMLRANEWRQQELRACGAPHTDSHTCCDQSTAVQCIVRCISLWWRPPEPKSTCGNDELEKQVRGECIKHQRCQQLCTHISAAAVKLSCMIRYKP